MLYRRLLKNIGQTTCFDKHMQERINVLQFRFGLGFTVQQQSLYYQIKSQLPALQLTKFDV